MGDAITKAAESMVDAADVISGMADSREAASTREEAEHFVSGSSENKGATENVVENTTTTGTVGTDIKAEEEETTENVETENSVEQNITTE